MQWTTTDELLAQLIEMSDAVGLRHLSALGAKRLPKPYRVPRPFAPPKPARRKATSEDLRRMFGGAIRYVGASN